MALLYAFVLKSIGSSMKFSFIKIFLHKLIIYSYKSIKNYFKNFTNTKPVLLILAKNIEISIKNKINYFYHRQIINNFNKKTDKSTKSVSPLGLEPRTHSLKGCRSNRLSYGPTVMLIFGIIPQK